MKEFDLDKENIPHPFKVPDGYFDELDSQIKENVEFSLGKSKRKTTETPFSVPENYFEQLNEKIMDEIAEEKSAPFISNTRNKLWYSVAAAVSLLIISVALSLQNGTTTVESNVLADISNDEILIYLDYYEVDEIDLLETIDENMEWINDEDQLLEEMDLENTNIEELYLEYGLSEII